MPFLYFHTLLYKSKLKMSHHLFIHLTFIKKLLYTIQYNKALEEEIKNIVPNLKGCPLKWTG